MQTGKLQNYAVTATRVLLKNPLYSSINILGLGAGLACCVLILLFVRDEVSFDRWLPDAERIYRVESAFSIPGRDLMEGAQAPGPASAALAKDFPNEIEHVVRLHERHPTITAGEHQFNETLLEVDPEFFEVFDLPIVAGDKTSALADNTSVVLTESMARKYFGDEDALGKTLTITREAPESYKVTAIIKDIPRNSHLHIDLISRFDPAHYADKPYVTDRWTSINVFIYAKFRTVEAAEHVRGQLKDFINRNASFGIPELEHIKPGDLLALNLQSVPRIHLYSSRLTGFGEVPEGDIVTVYTFSAVAVLILLIASINFMNLATARSLQRAREVSMRKTVGATRAQLVVQFIGESVLMTVIALAVAVLAVHLLLPWFNSYIDKHLTFNVFADPALTLWILALTVFVGVVAGLYPAFFLSRFRPALVLKANQSSGAEGSSALRSMLVVLQFAISIGLMVTTLVIYAQTRYATSMDLGYNKDHMLVIEGVGREKTQASQLTFKQELEKLPGVIATGRASDTIPQQSSNNTLVYLPDAPADDLLVVETLTVDHSFFPAIGVKPAAGRLFSPEFAGDVMPYDADKVEGEIHSGAILNLRAVKRLGYASPEAAIGQTFRITAGEEKKADITVVGVVNDMHYRSIRSEITPMIYFLGDSVEDFDALIVHVRSGDLPGTLAAVDSKWTELAPETPMERSFIEEGFGKLYKTDEARMKMFAGFAAFAVFVACLGLFGLASFAAGRRTREIGVRKVMGATAIDIVRLLVWQFSRPVLLANVLAWPAAYYFLQSWLNNFQYRTEITAVPFVVAGSVALAIAWGTVIGHAWRVSRSNPIHALRYE